MGSISSLLAQSSPTQTPPLTGGLEEATEPIVLLPLGERQNDGEEEKEEKEGSQKVTKNNNANEGSRGNDDDNYDDEIPMGEGEVLPQLHEGASQTDSHDLLPPLLATPTPKGTEKTPAGSPGSPSPLSNPQQSTTGTAATVDNETQPDKPGPLKVASFVRKVYEIVNDESNKELVSWWTKGPSFVVWHSADFSVKILPKYFKHGNFPSFVRQLNNYGFHKVESKEGEVFSHKYFRPNRPDLLRYIQRHKQIHGIHTRQSITPPAKAGTNKSHNNCHHHHHQQQQQQQHQQQLKRASAPFYALDAKLHKRVKEVRAQNEEMAKTLKLMLAELESIKASDRTIDETTESIMTLATALAKTRGINYTPYNSKYLFHKNTLKALRGTSNAFDATARGTESIEDPLNVLANAAQQQNEEQKDN